MLTAMGLRGLLQLTWVEIKIFLREPMGAFGTLAMPVLVFVVLGKLLRAKSQLPSELTDFMAGGLPIFAAVIVALSNVLSLTAIISIYREGGILKRLRATPLRPQTILLTHVLVKLLLTAVTLILLVLAGKDYLGDGGEVNLWSFGAALLLSMLSMLSIGFIIASVVPTARFAQPVSAVTLYPMMVVSGLFFPLDILPPVAEGIARCLPLTHAVELMQGIWNGGCWLDHGVNVAALVVNLVLCTVISGKIFRWE